MDWARSAVLAAATGLALLLVACSSKGSTAAGGSPNAGGAGQGQATGGAIPCSLATQSEVSSALGASVAAGSVGNTGDATLVLCDFNVQGTTGVVSVGVKTGVTKENLANASGVGPGSKPVPGVGEAAVAACGDSTVRYCTLAAYANGHVVFVQVSLAGGQDGALLATARTLALAAIPRL